MFTVLRNHRDIRRILLVSAGVLVLSVTAPLLLPKSLAADGNAGTKTPPVSRAPKLREVVELPEDYVGRDFTYTVRLSTGLLWITRGSSGDFFIVVEDLEGSQLPRGGIGPESTVKLIRFLLSKEDGRKLIDQLSAAQKYQARIGFRIEREKGLFGEWRYLARIHTVELSNSSKSK
jgi:hypothetical protein